MDGLHVCLLVHYFIELRSILYLRQFRQGELLYSLPPDKVILNGVEEDLHDRDGHAKEHPHVYILYPRSPGQVPCYACQHCGQHQHSLDSQSYFVRLYYVEY